jgi:hypothetical protein
MQTAVTLGRSISLLAVAILCFVGAVTLLDTGPLAASMALAVMAIVAASGALRGPATVRGAAVAIMTVVAVMMIGPIVVGTLLVFITPPRLIDGLAEAWAIVVPQLMLPYHLRRQLPDPAGTAACGVLSAAVAIATGALGGRFRLRLPALLVLATGAVMATNVVLSFLSVALGGDLGVETP